MYKDALRFLHFQGEYISSALIFQDEPKTKPVLKEQTTKWYDNKNKSEKDNIVLYIVHICIPKW